MASLQPYLIFPGTCEQALALYADCLGGTVRIRQRFSDAPFPVAESDRHRILHAEFSAGNIAFGASDGMPGDDIPVGRNVALMVNFDDEPSLERAWRGLLDGGEAIMPLNDGDGAPRFGMVIDRHGLQWMLAGPEPA